MNSTPRPQLTTVQRRIIAGVTLGAAVICVIGFIGSYAAVRRLALAKGFGEFATLFPVGLDAGILVLLALDLLLTWLRMQLSLLRHIAWVLTAATIAFNAAAAWPDPIGVGMHAVIPVLFIAIIEAARHAIGVAAAISAAKHMEPVRLSRWLLAPVRTFLLWRRMKLWELRSYDEVIALEKQRLAERLRLRAEFGRMWRRKAPVDTVIAYRMLRYGRPLTPAGAVAAPGPAAPQLPPPDALGDFDTVAASALAIAQPDAVDECAAEDAQPDALILDLARMRSPHPDVCAPAPDAHSAAPRREVRNRPVAKRAARNRDVVNMRVPDADAHLLPQACVLNIKSLREDGQKAPLRLLQKELSIGQARAQRIQALLPDTLAAALEQAQPTAKEA